MTKGIDVSEHQGVIDWEKVKPQIDFAMVRAGYGKNNIDPQFIRNATECNRLGIPMGIFWFSYARTAEMAKAEAAYCLAAIKPFRVEYPVCFDFEYASVSEALKYGVTVTKELASSMVTAFLTAIEAAKYYGMNYANADYLSRYFNTNIPVRFDTWLASWPTLETMIAALKAGDTTNPPRTCGIWQWGGKAYDGIENNVDSDNAYKDYAQIISDWGLNNLAPVTSPVVTPAPVSAVDTAIAKLKAAGYDDVLIAMAHKL